MPSGEIARTTGRAAAPVSMPAAPPPPPPAEDQALVVYGNSLQIMQQHAKVLAAADMLPAQYRRNSGNVLWAMEYGKALGISPIAVMLEIWTTPDGKPATSSKVMQALVRNRGHRLRLSAAADGQSATCTIIRKDDPESPTVVTYTMEMAKTAKLTGKKNWVENPVAMLKARAAAMCCRDACAEVLLGMYTPDELGSEALDDEVPEFGDYDAPQADPLANQRAHQAITAAFRRIGWEDGKSFRPAISVIIDREIPADETVATGLTVSEARAIVDKLTELDTMEALNSFLGLDQENEEAEAAEPEGEQEAEAAE